jgi:hypothetical protein
VVRDIARASLKKLVHRARAAVALISAKKKSATKKPPLRTT